MAAHSPVIKAALAEIGEETVDEVLLIFPDFCHEEIAGVLQVMYGEKAEVFVSHDIVKSLLLHAHTTLDSKSDTSAKEKEEKPTSMSFECPECHKLLPGLTSLYSHLEVCEESCREVVKPRQTYFKCSPCSKVFGSIEEINAHVREEHVVRGRRSKVEEAEEVREQEEDVEDVRVEQIEETIITLGEDRITVQTMSGQDTPEPPVSFGQQGLDMVEGYDVRYMCSDCDQIFITMLLLEKHREAKHSNVEPAMKHQCDFCQQHFSTREEHNQHLVNSHNQFLIDRLDQQKQHNFFKCSHCRESFTLVKDLTEHIVSKHAEVSNTNRRGKTSTADSKSFECGGCQTRFSLASSLHNHVKTCQSIPLNGMNRILLPTKVEEREQKAFLCPVCKGEFPSQAAVRLHTKSSKCKDAKQRALPRPIYPKMTANDLVAKLPISRDIGNTEMIFQIPDTDFKSPDTFAQSVLEGGDSLIFETSNPAPLIENLPNPENSQREESPSSLLVSEPFDNQRIVVLDQNGDPDLSLGPEVLIQSDVFEVEENSKAKDRKFVCSYCKNKYFARDHLISHMRTHTGEKPFEVSLLFMLLCISMPCETWLE